MEPVLRQFKEKVIDFALAFFNLNSSNKLKSNNRPNPILFRNQIYHWEVISGQGYAAAN